MLYKSVMSSFTHHLPKELWYLILTFSDQASASNLLKVSTLLNHFRRDLITKRAHKLGTLMMWYPNLITFDKGMIKHVTQSFLIDRFNDGTVLPYHKRGDLGGWFLIPFINADDKRRETCYIYKIASRAKISPKVASLLPLDYQGILDSPLGAGLLANPSMDWFLKDLLDFKEDVNHVSLRNPLITLSIIDTVLRDRPDLSYAFSSNPNLTPEYVLEHPHLIWDYTMIEIKKGVTEEFLELATSKERRTSYPKDSSMLSEEYITKTLHPSEDDEVLVDLFLCLKHPNIPIRSWLKAHRNYGEWEVVLLRALRKRALSFNEVPELWHYLLNECEQRHNTLEWSFAASHFWNSVSSNPYITMDVIKANPFYPWCVKGMSINPSISLFEVSEYIERRYH